MLVGPVDEFCTVVAVDAVLVESLQLLSILTGFGSIFDPFSLFFVRSKLGRPLLMA